MAIEFSKDETKEMITSLRRYLSEELEVDVTEMRAKFFLEYILKEIAPLAYNRGVKDAEDFLRARLEDLPATCFEGGLSYWQSKKKK